MSGANLELVEQLVDAFNQRNLAAMKPLLDPGIEWKPGGPAAVERDIYRGREQVSNGFVATWEAWDLFHLEPSEVRDLGDSIVWLGRSRMRGGASHVELNQKFAVHFLVRDGKVVRMEGFLDWQNALEAAGLSD
jgi:ketosteroid isomerase-like protein